MRLYDIKKQLQQEGKLEQDALFSYATLSATIHGNSFQNLVAVAFQKNQLQLYHANIDGSVGSCLCSIPYAHIEHFVQKHRFLYSYTEFSAENDHFRFYSYDKKVFSRGFLSAIPGGVCQ